MSGSALNQLVAERVMGWHKAGHAMSGPYWEGRNTLIEISKWNPADDLNQSVKVLMKAKEREPCNGLNIEYRDQGRWMIDLCGVWGRGNSLAIAMCRCALRASGVSEAEIEEAMKP